MERSAGETMNWSDPKSPIWPAIRFVVIAIVLGVMLAFNYNKWDARDWTTIITVLGTLGGFDGLKQVATKGAE